jgi:hypothetical protein
LATLVALVVWRLRLNITRPHHAPLAWPQAALLGAVIVAGMAARAAADQQGWWRVHSPPGQVLVAQVNKYVPLERELALLAYDLPRTTARPGDQLPVTLYWQALAPQRPNLRVFIHVLGPDGQLVAQSDKENPADFPMSRWPTDHYVRDEHDLRLGHDVPPGEYHVVAGLWDGATGERMHTLNGAGQATTMDGVVLAEKLIVRP